MPFCSNSSVVLSDTLLWRYRNLFWKRHIGELKARRSSEVHHSKARTHAQEIALDGASSISSMSTSLRPYLMRLSLRRARSTKYDTARSVA